MSGNTSAPEFQPNISLATPLQDYKKLIEEKMQSEEIVDDDVRQENYAKISAKMRETIWKLLFMEQPPKMGNLLKAGDCLREHKMDACFYAPWEYNEWIPKVRDELLKRQMLDFWRDQIVKSELGPCWARDSDFFDDMDDPEPAEFYEYAGCVAPFIKEDSKVGVDGSKPSQTAATTFLSGPSNLSSGSRATTTAKIPDTISLETPKEDYKVKLEHVLKGDPDDEDQYNHVFEEVREVIWKLLFVSDSLTPENYSKAAKTLEAYKRDACVFNPWDYNDWIVKVRDELLARKYFDFWKNVIGKQELGLCWYKDSEYFDDMEDTAPMEFYKSGDKLMNEQAK